MKISMAVLAAALAVSPAAAQTAGKAVGTFKPKSCGQPGQELERTFQLALKPGQAPMPLVYAGCSEEGRNDYLSGYTERYYEGKDGYGLTLVTNHGDGAYVTEDETKRSDVLVSKDGTWIGRLGTVANDALLSQGASAGALTVRAAGKAVPSLPRCEARLPKQVYGPNELWLLTKTKAYYQRADCDICAELDSCDLKTGEIKTVITAHTVECSDLAPLAKGQDVQYDVCAAP